MFSATKFIYKVVCCKFSVVSNIIVCEIECYFAFKMIISIFKNDYLNTIFL
jgi:hypothetical protein